MMLAVFVPTVLLLDPALSPLAASNRVSNRGAIKAIGVGVYSDSACTTKLTSIDWGVLDPGQSRNATAYIRNEGNSAMLLTQSAANWTPSNASNYITLRWDYRGSLLTTGSVVKVTFTLAVSSSISGITDFSFDLTIVGAG